MKKEYDVMLHLLTRHTNLVQPYSDYVQPNIFPEQISELLNTEVTIKYRNHYLSDRSLNERAATIIRNGEIISSRPSDDRQQIETRVSKVEEDEFPFVSEGTFRIVRADATPPYRLIGISTNYQFIIVNSSEQDESGEYAFTYLVSEYPTQLNEYIGLECYNQYGGEIQELRAATLRVDATEPCYSILIEFLGSTGIARFILGDEAASILYDYYDIDGSSDYNAKHATEELNPTDVTGEYADADKVGIVWTNVNGGPANKWDKMYENETVMKDEEIYEFRKSILEGIKIYGAI